MSHSTALPAIDKVSSGDQDVSQAMTTAIFESHYAKIYNYIYYRVCCDKHLAEDLTSEVLEKIILKINTYNKDKAQLDVWMFAIAKNTVNDHFRYWKKRKLFSIESIKNLIAGSDTPEGLALAAEQNRSLAAALSTLKQTEQNIIALKFGANLKNTEIAALLNMSETNVGVTLYRSVKKLRNEMSKEDVL